MTHLASLTPGLVVRRLAIAGLAALAAYFHWTLGSTVFLLNALGYAALGLAAVVLRRHGAVARLALLGFSVTTILLWVAVGARFDLAYETKAVETALVAMLVVDLRAEFLARRTVSSKRPSAPLGLDGRPAESL